MKFKFFSCDSALEIETPAAFIANKTADSVLKYGTIGSGNWKVERNWGSRELENCDTNTQG